MSDADARLKLLVVIASTRPVRTGLPVGEWFAGFAREHSEFEVTVADLKELDLPLMNEPKHPRLQQYEFEYTKRWSAMVEASDAFVFVFPEYNFGMAAPLKNALDYLVKEWNYKPVGLVSYGGVSGGLRAATQVRATVINYKMVPLNEAMPIFSVSNDVHDGVFTPNDSVVRSATTMLGELRRWALALRPLRDGTL